MPHGDSAASPLLAQLGGEAGCLHLSRDFYARVAKDPLLKPLFPGKSLRCATEEFAAFLVQFLHGDEQQTQKRWWLSLRESHARFRIAPEQRAAWLRHMQAALAAAPLEPSVREAFNNFFQHSSSYVVQRPSSEIDHPQLAARWHTQLQLDTAVAAITSANDAAALALVPQFTARPAVFLGLLARMMQAGRPQLVRFVLDAITAHPSLIERPFSGKRLLHAAAATGCLPVVELLLHLRADPDSLDQGHHTPLYSVANQCASPAGPAIVRALIAAGASVNACAGVTRATPLHMAARRGFVEIAATLLDCGAAINARDAKGDTPLRRALNCRQPSVANLLRLRGA